MRTANHFIPPGRNCSAREKLRIFEKREREKGKVDSKKLCVDAINSHQRSEELEKSDERNRMIVRILMDILRFIRFRYSITGDGI